MKNLHFALTSALAITVLALSFLFDDALQKRDGLRQELAGLRAADEKLKAADHDLKLACGDLQENAEAAQQLLIQVIPLLEKCQRHPWGYTIVPRPRPTPRPSEDVCPFNSPTPCTRFEVH